MTTISRSKKLAAALGAGALLAAGFTTHATAANAEQDCSLQGEHDPCPLYFGSTPHDASVSQTAPNSVNNGEYANVSNASGRRAIAYFKFALPARMPASATLRYAEVNLHSYVNGSDELVAFSVPNTSWSESALTWRNQPASSTRTWLDSNDGAWYTSQTRAPVTYGTRFDVTKAVADAKAAGKTEITIGVRSKSASVLPIVTTENRRDYEGPSFATLRVGTYEPRR